MLYLNQKGCAEAVWALTPTLVCYYFLAGSAGLAGAAGVAGLAAGAAGVNGAEIAGLAAGAVAFGFSV